MKPAFPLPDRTRVIGRHRGAAPGPLIVVTAGLHGNEPAGVVAARRVLDRLAVQGAAFRGELLALAGNLPALERGCRFVDEDLNRIWTRERIDAAMEGVPARSVEEGELRGILTEIGQALARHPSAMLFLDLHTTSAPGAPFSILADTLPNRSLARTLPVPMVLGFEEHLEGTLLNFINDLGHVAVAFEGGAHDDPSSIETHELGIWRTLIRAGAIAAADCPDLERLTLAVRDRAGALPRVVEIRSRHEVDPKSAFVMEPGFENLRRIDRGQLLAHDRTGEIRAREAGRILMPLYQSQGSDGFFIVREVRRFWLTLSAWMRWAGLDRIARFLPGVRTVPGAADTLVVDPGIARWFVVDIFHLLGFRRLPGFDGKLAFIRRREAALSDLGPHLKSERQ